MTRRLSCIALALWIGITAYSACAQRPESTPVVGVLMGNVASGDPVIEAFRAGLRDKGYIEGRNIRIEFRGAQGNLDLLPALADELVRLKVDAIVVGNERSAKVAKQASATIPIVVSLYNYDPVAGGLIESFARPAGNLTGLFTRTSELVGKRLEQLKEIIPNLSKLAVFWDPLGKGELDELQSAARLMGIQLQLMELQPPFDFDAAFKTAKRNKADAVLIIATNAFYVERARLGALALENAMPVSSSFRDCTQAGGLISYGIEFRDAYYRLAYFVDRVLKGAKPADLPFEQVTKFLLVVNLNSAKSLGLSPPQSILLRADEIIR
ncbi:MAG TPA: ABC transporter substrate-binding protein [Casimicrobiaceae bacterium]|nr:ABC transporter substrate-binding protein [Casimicrobiaceae bacterium]